MHERSASAGCRFFLPAVLLILGGLAVGTSPAYADKPDPKEDIKEKTVIFSMDGKPWLAVFKWLSDQTGKEVIGAEMPRGTFTFHGPIKKVYTIPEVIDIINDALLDPERADKFYLTMGERSLTLRSVDESHKRFQQIKLQLSLQPGGESAVFTRPEVVKKLKVSADQQAKIKAIEQERRKALLPLFLTNESAGAIEKVVKAHTAETLRLLIAELDADQRQQLQELIGEPSRLVTEKRYAIHDMRLPPPPPERFVDIAHVYGNAPSYQGSHPITGPRVVVNVLFDQLAVGSDEMRISDLDALGKRDGDAGLRERLQAFVTHQAITNGKLTRDQVFAFVEAELKVREKDNPPGSELHQWVWLLHDTAVQEELIMSKEQLRQCGEMTKEWTKQQADLRERQEKAIAALLDEKQLVRLRQLALQQQLPEGGLLTFLRRDIVSENHLQVDKEHQEAIRDLFRETDRVRVLIRCELYRVTDGKLDEDYRKTMDAFNRTVDKKLDEILTAEQREQLQAMFGEPFGKQNMRVPVGLPR